MRFLSVGSLSGVTVTGNDGGTLTVSGLASGVNTVRSEERRVGKGGREGCGTLHVKATSTDPGAAASAATADQTVGSKVNPVSDTPAVTVPTTGVSLDENTSHAIAGVSVTPEQGTEYDLQR